MANWKVLVTIDAGKTYRFAREGLDIAHSVLSTSYKYIPGILDITIPVLGVDDSTVEVSILNSALNVKTLRTKGLVLNGANAEVSLWRAGEDWERRIIILQGRVSPTGVVREDTHASLTLEDYAEQLDRPFPPWTLEKEGFPSLDDDKVGYTMPVLYGTCKEVPLIQVDKDTPGATEIKYVIAGHPVASKSIVMKVGNDEADLLYNYVDTKPDHHSGAHYSYITMPGSLIADAGTTNYIGEVDGHSGSAGGLISGLGDVIMHALKNYSKLPEERYDMFRFSKFVTKANAIAISSMFGGTTTETLINTLKSRYESQFNILLSWRNGKLGADFLFYDINDKPIKRLELKRNMVDRIGGVTTNMDSAPYTSFKVFYDVNISSRDPDGNPRFKASFVRDQHNDAKCRESASYFGDVFLEPIQLVDINDERNAEAVFNVLVDQFAVLRSKVTYLLHLDEIIRHPIYEKYNITDSELGWADEPFRLDEVIIREDDFAECTFTSYNFIP